MKKLFDSNLIMNRLRAALLTLIVGTAVGINPVHADGHEAEEASAHTWSANMSILSEYVFRGITQSNEDPAIQVGIDYGHESGLYVGFWASSVEFNSANTNGTQLETNIYFGIGGSFGSVDYDLGGLFYYYPEEDDDEGAGEQDLFEVYGSLGTGFDMALEPSVTVGFAYSPDYYGEDGDSIYFYGDIGFSFPYGISPYVTLGYLDVDGDQTTPGGYDYFHYVIGASYDIGQFTFDLSWSEAEEGADAAGASNVTEAVIFSVSSSW